MGLDKFDKSNNSNWTIKLVQLFFLFRLDQIKSIEIRYWLVLILYSHISNSNQTNYISIFLFF